MAMLGALASAMVWSLPLTGELRTGYERSTRPSALGILLVVEWYALIFVSMRLGELIAKRSRLLDFGQRFNVPLESLALLRTFTLLSSVGLLLTYSKILGAISMGDAFLFLASGIGNELKENLYEQYSAGFVSLRYLVMYSVTLSAYRYSRTRRLDLLLVVNVLLLALSAVISSRLIFVSTVLVVFFILNHHKRFLSIRFIQLVAWTFVIFAVLAVLNYSRNSNYYAADGFEFWGAGLSSIVTYVGSPFQVLLSVASNPEGVVGQPIEAYRNFTDISVTLNSNSAFVALHESIGFWAWPYITSVAFVVGFAFSKCYKAGRSALLLPCGAILYACAELWRLDLFTQGIFVVWLSVGITLPLVIGTASSVVRRFGWQHSARRSLGPRSESGDNTV